RTEGLARIPRRAEGAGGGGRSLETLGARVGGMKMELPSSEEYYRPTAARDLREKAARADRWARRLQLPLRSLAGCLLLGWLATFGCEGPVFCMLAYVIAVPVLACLAASPLLREQAVHYRQQATVLEGEHHARYGPGPEAEEQ